MSNLRNKIALEFGVHGQRNIDEQGLQEIFAIIERYPKTMGVYSEFNSNSKRHEQK
jgi:hypothetical protein